MENKHPANEIDLFETQETTKIGFIGPYYPSDTTEAILSLADLTFRCGYSPVLYSQDTKFKDLHPRWTTPKPLTNSRLLFSATLVIWDSYLPVLKEIWSKVSNIPKIMVLEQGFQEEIPECNYCLVRTPEQLTYSLRTHLGKKAVFLPWSSGRLLSDRHLRTNTQKLNRVAIYLPPDYPKYDTSFLPLLLKTLVKNNYNVTVCGFVSPRLKQLLIDIYTAYKDCISLAFSPSYLERRAVARHNDWIIVLNLRNPAVSIIGEFLDYAIPVICVEHKVLTDHFGDNILSIPSICYNNSKNPSLRINTFLKECFSFLEDYKLWDKVTCNLEQYSEIRQREFISRWSEMITSCMRLYYSKKRLCEL